MEIFKLGDDILALLEMVLGFWNNQINLVFSLLGQSPVSFKGGGPWAVVESLQPLFVGVGSGLVVLFFVIGFCAESVDIKSEFRFEAMLRMLIRLGIAQWLVANNLTILKAFFSSIGAMVSHLGNTAMAQASIGAGEAEVIENLGFATSLVPDTVGDIIAHYPDMRLFHHLHGVLPLPEDHGDCAAGGDCVFHSCREPGSKQHLCPVF